MGGCNARARILDDEQFDEITVKRGEIIKGGRVDVELYEIEGKK